MSKFIISGASGLDLSKRMLKLAWDASGVFGMGALQDRGQQDENSVWNAMAGANDYRGSETKKPATGNVAADYVFGRMMKLNFAFGENYVVGGDRPFRHDYQSFAGKYPNFGALVLAAAKDLGATVEEVKGTP